MTNFNKDLNTKDKFLGEPYVRELMDDGCWSSVNMEDDVLRTSIISDLLAFVFWEKEYKEPLNITFSELTRFVDRADLDRIQKQLDHDEIKHLIDVTEGVYRLKEDRQILQAAMDYCGVWYSDYDAPSDFGVVSVNHVAIDEAVQQHGSIENLAISLAMELTSGVPFNTQLT